MSFAIYLQRLGDFALAQIFHPDMVPAAGRGADPHWVRVPDLVTRLETVVAAAPVYELAEARLCRGLQRLVIPWPRLWGEAVTVSVAATLGVDLTDAAQLQALDQAAHAALWEAYDALYGPRSL